MPFVSDKQRKYMYANKPKVAKKLAKHKKKSKPLYESAMSKMYAQKGNMAGLYGRVDEGGWGITEMEVEQALSKAKAQTPPKMEDNKIKIKMKKEGKKK